MDAPIEPSEFDLIVVGTGLPQSIFAAASALAGKKVLHLDASDFYGSHWSSHSPNSLLQWLHSNSSTPSPSPVESRLEDRQNGSSGNQMDDSSALELPPIPDDVQIIEVEAPSRVAYHSLVYSELGEDVRSSRNYSLDLAGPRLSFCTGPMVDLIVKSGAHNYMEFKAMEASYLWVGAEGGRRGGGELMQVPSSRSDVFQDRSLGLADKRALMRFFNLVNDYSATTSASVANGHLKERGLSPDKLAAPFVQLLQKQRLQNKIRACILYAIALIEHDQEGGGGGELVSAREGLDTMVLYLNSMARFGQGAFLYPLYGQAELPQAFCRTAAVKGSIYVLRRPVTAVVVDKNSGRYRGVKTGTGQLLFSPTLIASPGFGLAPVSTRVESGGGSPEAPPGGGSSSPDQGVPRGGDDGAQSGGRQVARCMCVTDRSLVEDRSVVLVVFPPRSLGLDQARAIRSVQLGASVSVSPPNRFIVQFSVSCDVGQAAESLLRPAVDALFDRADATSASADTPASADMPAQQAADESPPSSSAAPEQEGSREGTGHHPPSAVGEEEQEGVSGREELTQEVRPRLLWSVYFTQEALPSPRALPEGVVVGPMPDASLDYRGIVASCSQTFAALFPGEEFFPPPTAVSEDPDEDEPDLGERTSEAGEHAGDQAGDGNVDASGDSNCLNGQVEDADGS